MDLPREQVRQTRSALKVINFRSKISLRHREAIRLCQSTEAKLETALVRAIDDSAKAGLIHV